MQNSIRTPYDRVVMAVPVTIPYVRYSIESAQWWIGRALKSLVDGAGITPRDIDGFCVSSFTAGLDSGISLTQHFGLCVRWIDTIPLGGASAIAALRRAARAVQAGDARIVACVAGDTNHVDSFRYTLENFSRFNQDAVYPYGAGGANASFALIARNYMRTFGARREDFGKIAVAQRSNALRNPHALMKAPLTIEQYMSARPIADPIHLFDCVMPCAGAEAFLVMSEDVAASLKLPAAKILSTIERHNAFGDDPVQVRGGWAMDVDELYAMAGVKPDDHRLRPDLRRLPRHLDDAVRGSRLLPQGRRAGLRAAARSHDRRQLPAQHLRRATLGRAGRRGRRLSRGGRGDAAGARAGRSDPGQGCADRVGVGLRNDQL